jgi:hypothetical protein
LQRPPPPFDRVRADKRPRTWATVFRARAMLRVLVAHTALDVRRVSKHTYYAPLALFLGAFAIIAMRWSGTTASDQPRWATACEPRDNRTPTRRCRTSLCSTGGEGQICESRDGRITAEPRPAAPQTYRQKTSSVQQQLHRIGVSAR